MKSSKGLPLYSLGIDQKGLIPDTKQKVKGQLRPIEPDEDRQ
jgi:hypothetical protein